MKTPVELGESDVPKSLCVLLGQLLLVALAGYKRRIGARKPSRSIIICHDNDLAKEPFGRRNIGRRSHLIEQLLGESPT